ncbi:MAG TPA: hypothetical protein VGF71_13990 [Caulobacteraceae bacterium]|jgi:hypothetical protein
MTLPGRALFAPLVYAWLILVLVPFLLAAPTLVGWVAVREEADLLFVKEDAWVVGAMTALLLVVPVAGRLKRPWKLSPRASIWALAVIALAISAAGVRLVFGGFALSRDEDMANFGAQILSHGQLWATVPPGWRDFTAGLEPEFVRFSSGSEFWQPAYLPVNAALRALAGPAAALVNPALAAGSVLATYAVGRRLWPEQQDLAVIAALFVAISSQVLAAAMTPYAMTAHMAFNLAWLWLHLRGGKAGHAGALVVGFLAAGLHQLVFHPMFAAPFVAQLWLDRRWRVAAVYTLAYAAICLFWLELSPLALAWQGGSVGHAATGVGGLGLQVSALIGARHPPILRSMAENLLRFVSWQGLLAAPLAAIGAYFAVRTPGPLRSMVAGLALTTAALFVLMPYQGYGWGYRYWHGLIGPIALLAASGWRRLTEFMTRDDRAAANRVFALAAAISALVLIPIRLVQAHNLVQPYMAAWRAVEAAPTPLVVVDPTGAWYLDDLVRNDPYLTNRPLILHAEGLRPDQLGTLCQRYPISVLDAAGAARFGVRVLPGKQQDLGLTRWRTLGLPATCGPDRTPILRIGEPSPQGASR